MQPANRFAFKEWGAVCAALGAGAQSVILRKGGIHEGPGGFRPDHDEFWLFPTRFHQAPEEIAEAGRHFIDVAARDEPPPGRVRLSLYAAVDQAIPLADEALLVELAGEHILAPHVVAERFHYRRPGLFVLPVRVFALPEPIELPDSPHFAGCRSWVDLPNELSTERLRPVLTDEQHAERVARLRREIAPRRIV